MKLIEPSVEILEQSSGLNGIYEQIEIAGRTCYKSEPTYSYFYTGKNPHDGGDITVQVSKEFDGEKAIEYAEKEYLNGNPSYSRKSISAKTFVDRMVASKHYAMLEHGTVYLKVNAYNNEIAYRYKNNKYSKVVNIGTGESEIYYITTNYRVLIENNWLNDLRWFIVEPTEYHEKRITSKFICDRGVSHELVRHRVFSFAQESTRYCNYSKDKFGNELTFIIPSWFKTLKEASDEKLLQTYSKEQVEKGMNRYYAVDNCENEWVISLLDQEVVYISLIDNGWTPQQARVILPNALKTEVVMTGFESDYTHFFELRCAKAAHPDMQVLANRLKELM